MMMMMCSNTRGDHRLVLEVVRLHIIPAHSWYCFALAPSEQDLCRQQVGANSGRFLSHAAWNLGPNLGPKLGAVVQTNIALVDRVSAGSDYFRVVSTTCGWR